MTATRLAFSSALVLILSAFLCNAQEATSDGSTYKVVNLKYGFGTAMCMLDNRLSKNEIDRVATQQLYCVTPPQDSIVLDCVFEGNTCEVVQNLCNSLNGQVLLSESCKEIVGQRN